MVHYLPLPPAGSREERQAWVDRTVDAFDLVTINVPINPANGIIPEDSHAQLVRLGRHLPPKS